MADFFFGGSTPDCELPCWQGLRVGESKLSDVQAMFDRVFGFNGFLYPLPDIIMDPPAGYEIAGHSWDISGYPYSSFFQILTWFRQDTGVLVGIDFAWITTSDFQLNMSTQRVLRELGAPSYAFIDVKPGGQGPGYHLGFFLLMIYSSGLSFTYLGELPIEHRGTGDTGGTEIAQFCLGDDFGYTAKIREPLTNGLNDLTPLQELTYTLRVQMAPIQEILGSDPDEIARRAIQEQNPCFSIEVPGS